MRTVSYYTDLLYPDIQSLVKDSVELFYLPPMDSEHPTPRLHKHRIHELLLKVVDMYPDEPIVFEDPIFYMKYGESIIWDKSADIGLVFLMGNGGSFNLCLDTMFINGNKSSIHFLREWGNTCNNHEISCSLCLNDVLLKKEFMYKVKCDLKLIQPKKYQDRRAWHVNILFQHGFDWYCESVLVNERRNAEDLRRLRDEEQDRKNVGKPNET